MTNEKPSYKCPICDEDDLGVTVEYIHVDYFTTWVSCDCGQSDEGAAVRTYHTMTVCERQGTLDDDHHYDLEPAEEVESLGEEEDDYELLCPDCLEEASEGDWEVEMESEESEDCDTEVHVWCGGCGREIEFGWSHPDRGGRIWPAECPNFNPWQCWPEPRFVESWHGKGWLRPVSIEEAAAGLGIATVEVAKLIESGQLFRHPKCQELATDAFGLQEFEKTKK
jgi:hypothetical protein